MKEKARKAVKKSRPVRVVRKGARKLDPEQELALIRKGKRRLAEPPTRRWLDTGFPHLNAALGSDRGLAYGRIIEVFGNQSNGKTALALDIAGCAQKKDAARLVVIDTEACWDAAWAETRGVDTSQTVVICPYLAKPIKGAKEPELVSGTDLCSEAEALIRRWHRTEPDRPIVLVLDSLAALLSPEELESELDEVNRYHATRLSMFLSQTLRKWVGLFHTHTVLPILVNQIREKPGVVFGSPEYTPGGKATLYYASVRARLRRYRALTNQRKKIGIAGAVFNLKNKSGGREGEACSFRIYWEKPSEYFEFKKKGEDE